MRRTFEKTPQGDALLKLSEVCKLLSVGRSTIYEWINQDGFPQPVRMGGRSVRWESEEVQQWRRALARGVASS
jgi:prophage regulatory protein